MAACASISPKKLTSGMSRQMLSPHPAAATRARPKTYQRRSPVRSLWAPTATRLNSVKVPATAVNRPMSKGPRLGKRS